MLEPIRRALYRWYTRLDQQISRLHNDPLEIQSVSEAINDLPILSVDAISAQHDSEQADRVGFNPRQSELVIDLCATGNSPSYSRIPQFGVWRLQFGSFRQQDFVPDGFVELLSGSRVVEARLMVQLPESAGPRVAAEYVVPLNDVYLLKGVQSVYWRAATVIRRVIGGALDGGLKEFVRKLSVTPTLGPSELAAQSCGIRDLLRLVGKSGWRWLRYRIESALYDEQWVLLYQLGVSSIKTCELEDLTQLAPARDRFWADPFVVAKNDVHHIFFEELVYSEGKGTIAHMSIEVDGSVSEPTTVLEKPYHLSYPFLFEYEDDLYMVPESAENRSVDLYKSTDFPFGWTYIKTLISDEALYDATLTSHGGRWWLFASREPDTFGTTSDELVIYHCDNPLTSDWTPLSRCPAVADVRCARPAGDFFIEDDQQFRPAQDCSTRYGGAIDIRLVRSLSTSAYSDQSFRRIQPSQRSSILGVHTINATSSIIIADALVKKRRFLR
ncbi:MAG: hypothetical protein AAF351_12200 [Pseudomonadota bacterium]